MDVPKRKPGTIERDLKNQMKGEVYFDDYHRILYSTAACIFQVKPLGVVLPCEEEDVAKLITYARENGIALTARGAGSGVAGQTVNSGIIVDFSKYMNRIIEIDPDNDTVRVQPGLVYDQLNRKLKAFGKFFPPDPSSGPYCTIGGMIGNNSGGSHSVLYGSMKENIQSVRAFMSGGVLLKTQPLLIDSLNPSLRGSDDNERYCLQYAHLLKGNELLLESWKPQVNRNSSGYNLFDSCQWNGSQSSRIDLAQLFVGSEGTLCLVTEAVLKMRDLPKKRGTALSLFDSVEKAGEAVIEILKFSPSSLEIMDHSLVKIVKEENPEMRAALPEDCRAILILEVDGDEEEEVHSILDDIRASLLEKRLAFEFKKALTSFEQERLWKVRKSASPILSSKEGIRRNTRFVEDASVLPERLPEFISGMRKIISKYGFQAAIFGHAGDSNIHVNPLLNQRDADDLEKMERIADESAELVFSLKGSLTGEHGDGRLRSSYLPRMFGPLHAIFEEVKTLFDPEHLLNPGIKVGRVEGRITNNLRYGKDYERSVTGSRLDEKSWQLEVEKCHGCGTCRQYCPVFLATGDERATSRGKANLLRAAISRNLDQEVLFDGEFKEIVDLCFNCGLCHVECPTKIKIPEISRIAKDIYSGKKGLDWATFLLNRSAILSKFSSAFASISNITLRSKILRKLGEILTGISSSLALEEFSSSPMEKDSEIRSAVMGNKKVVYFYGCFANFNDPGGEGRGTIEVLRRNGFDVIMPPQACCGIASLSNGDTHSVIPDAQFNVETFAAYIGKGIDVIYSAPSCGMAIVEEYPKLLNTRGAEKLAKHCYEIHEFLKILKGKGELNTDFGELKDNIVYHNPCHLEARDMGSETLEILEMIPGLNIIPIEDSCCGMAGTFGMKAKYRELSRDIGKPLFDQIHVSGVTTVSTGCGTCNLQIRDITRKKVVHPIALIAKSYENYD
jgi:FAD/FMN-containing dehydrogenase/Fe-S oxidoreductase